MGLGTLLKHVVGWPATGPGFLIGFSMRNLQRAAVAEVAEEGPVREELLELQLQLQLGEIGEDEYVEREAELMRRLREVRVWREHLGMPVRGPAVRVVRDTDEPGQDPHQLGPGTGEPAPGTGEPASDTGAPGPGRDT